VESWQQKFLHGNLGDTWQEQYPQLFSTDDLVHSRSIYGKNPNTFATWLGAILLQRQTGYKSIFGNYLQAKSHEKHKPLRDTLSITRFLQLQPLIKKIGAAGAPTLFLCEHPEYSDIKTDTESVFSNEQAGVFIYVRYGHEHFSSEQVQWIKALHQEGYSLWAIHLQKM
jgi:hypothetical protein